MTDPEIMKLIDETLEWQRIEPCAPESRLVVNVAAVDLQRCGAEALPLIEDVVRQRLQPHAWKSSRELFRRFLGISNLWMAYLSIAGTENVPRVIEFLRSLDGPVLSSAIHGIRCQWPYDEPGNVSMPRALLDFIREVARTRDDEAGEAARRYPV